MYNLKIADKVFVLKTKADILKKMIEIMGATYSKTKIEFKDDETRRKYHREYYKKHDSGKHPKSVGRPKKLVPYEEEKF